LEDLMNAQRRKDIAGIVARLADLEALRDALLESIETVLDEEHPHGHAEILDPEATGPVHGRYVPVGSPRGQALLRAQAAGVPPLRVYPPEGRDDSEELS
jgi:hypothetical protein